MAGHTSICLSETAKELIVILSPIKACQSCAALSTSELADPNTPLTQQIELRHEVERRVLFMTIP